MIFFDLCIAAKFCLLIYLIYIQLSSLNPSVKRKILTGIIYVIVGTAASSASDLIISEPYKSSLLILLSSIFFAAAGKKRFAETFFFVIISYCLSFLIYIISIAASAIVFDLLFGISGLDVRISVLAFVFSIILIALICRIKFKIILTYKRGFGSAGIMLSGISLIIFTTLREGGLPDEAFRLILAGGILCALGLFCWVKRESVAAYSEKLYLLANSKLRAENEQLSEIRLYLEKIVHNDSKKLPAYQEAVSELIESAENPAAKEKALRILAEIKDSREDYSAEVSEKLQEKKAFPSTGLELLDAIFKHYNKICAAKNIDFDLIVRGTPDLIKQLELETLAANLLDNAIIACEHCVSPDKRIVVNLNSEGMSVTDNGIAFEPETLEGLGKQRITTHAGTGGRGLGYLTIFDITRPCKASIIITAAEEYKTVAVQFDGADRYKAAD
jgi:signal transduction histidine kinase